MDETLPCFSLTFLVYRCEENPGRFVAHCLEFDVVAVEDTIPGALLLLKELVDDLLTAAMEDGTLDQVFRPAPDEYWRRLAHARTYKAPERVAQARIGARNVKRVDYALVE